MSKEGLNLSFNFSVMHLGILFLYCQNTCRGCSRIVPVIVLFSFFTKKRSCIGVTQQLTMIILQRSFCLPAACQVEMGTLGVAVHGRPWTYPCDEIGDPITKDWTLAFSGGRLCWCPCNQGRNIKASTLHKGGCSSWTGGSWQGPQERHNMPVAPLRHKIKWWRWGPCEALGCG